MAGYAAAKAFVVRFTEALWYELRATDLTATVVSPGPSRTEFSARGGTDTRGTRFQAPEQVVTTALAALDRRTPPVSLVSGRAHRLIRRLAALLPTRATLRLAESRPATP